MIYELGNSLFSEVNQFFVSQNNKFFCNELLEIIFTYTNINQIKENDVQGFLTDDNRILSHQSTQKCLHYRM